MLDKKTRPVSKLETINYEQDVWNGVPIDEEFLNFYAITYLKGYKELSRFIYTVRFDNDKKDIEKNIIRIITMNNIHYKYTEQGWYSFDEVSFDRLFSILIEDYKKYKKEYTEDSNVFSEISESIKNFETLIEQPFEEQSKTYKRYMLMNDANFFRKFGIQSINNLSIFYRITFMSVEYLSEIIKPILKDENIQSLTDSDNTDFIILNQENYYKFVDILIDTHNVDTSLEELKDIIKSKDTKDASETIESVKQFLNKQPLEKEPKQEIDEDFEKCLEEIEISFVEPRVSKEIDIQLEARTIIETRILDKIRNGKEAHKSDLDSIYALSVAISVLEKLIK